MNPLNYFASVRETVDRYWNGSPSGFIYEGCVYNRTDFQKGAVKYCGHNHRLRPRAERCSRRLLRELIKET